MILIPHNVESEVRQRVIDAVVERATLACGSRPLMIEQVARAVADYLDAGRRRVDPDSAYPLLLASQALSGLGRFEAARSLLVFGAGVARPSRWYATGAESAWTVDVRRITASRSDRLELTLFAGVRAVIDAIAPVWDDTSGRGALGLRCVRAAVRDVVGAGSRRRRAESLYAEIYARSSDRLAKLQAARDWDDRPMLMRLDY
jgi:hypothetical protein